jgi:ABC-type uncharacterized transport system substrate-binding protein
LKANLLILAVGTLILASIDVSGAQQATKTPRLGFISSAATPGRRAPLFDAFRQALSDLGYIDGKTILIESRYAEGRLDRMPSLVNELIQQKVDVILAVNNVVIRAAKKATKTIPIVMISSVDPVAAGYIESFARPGGNITGVAQLGRDLSAKRVELFKEVLPKMSRVAVLWDTDGPGPRVAVKEYEAAARAFKIEFRSLPIRGPNPDFAGAFQSAKTLNADALMVVGNPLITGHAKTVFELAARNRLPSMTEERRYVNAGGLISYGASQAALMQRAASYVVEILKGANPAELQVKLAEKFEIFVNLKTAKQIGVVIPQHVLVQSDMVIQ